MRTEAGQKEKTEGENKRMTLYFEEEGETRLHIPCEDLAREVAEEALEYTG